MGVSGGGVYGRVVVTSARDGEREERKGKRERGGK